MLQVYSYIEPKCWCELDCYASPANLEQTTPFSPSCGYSPYTKCFIYLVTRNSLNRVPFSICIVYDVVSCVYMICSVRLCVSESSMCLQQMMWPWTFRNNLPLLVVPFAVRSFFECVYRCVFLCFQHIYRYIFHPICSVTSLRDHLLSSPYFVVHRRVWCA